MSHHHKLDEVHEEGPANPAYCNTTQLQNSQAFFQYTKILSIACLLSLSFGSQYSAHVLGTVKTQLIEGLGINNQLYGSLQSSVGIVNTIIPVFGGAFVDSFGSCYVAFCATTLILIGNLLATIAAHLNSYHLMVSGRIVYGFGSGTIILIQETVFSSCCKRSDYSKWLGFFLSFGRLGSFLSTALSARIARSFSFYGYALWASTGICLISWIFCIMFILLSAKSQKRVSIQNRKGKMATKKIFSMGKHKHFPVVFWIFLIYPYIISGAWTSFVHMDVEIIKLKFGKTTEEAGLYASVVQLGVFILYPLCGFVLDKVGKRPIFMLFSAIMFVASIYTLGFSKAHPILPLIMFTFSLGFGPVVLVSLINSFVPKKLLGTALGFYASSTNVGDTIQDVIVGKLQDIGKSHTLAMNYLIGLGCVAIMISVIIIVIDSVFLKSKLGSKTSELENESTEYNHHTKINCLGIALVFFMIICSCCFYILGLQNKV